MSLLQNKNTGKTPDSTSEMVYFAAKNTRMACALRAILSAVILVVVFFDPPQPVSSFVIILIIMAFYTIYAVGIYLASRGNHVPILLNYQHWLDACWFLGLVAFSGGTNSVFFSLFYFAILIASFRFGFIEGLKVTVFLMTAFTIVGYFAAPAGVDFELNRFLLRPLYLGIIGYMIAYWGGQEITHIKRLEILKDINKLYNPRFGIDQTMNAIMQKILDSFDAQSCLLITVNTDGTSYTLRQCFPQNPEQAIHAEKLYSESPLIRLPCEYAVIYHNKKRFWTGNTISYMVFDSQGNRQPKETAREGEVLADLLETNSFISIPLCQRDTVTWRLYLTSETKKFDYLDIEFLRQLLEQALPVAENVNLLDRLASDATEQQRQKISRDIHDGTIQPYIGIKLGLEALQIKHGTKNGISDDINQLINLAETNIQDIRSYLNRLRGDKTDVKVGNVLVSAIKQQAKKISEFYGIQIEVFAENNFINISDRLAAEIFQIVTESLSNIKRHTKAEYALIAIDCDHRTLKLKVQNNKPEGDEVVDFIPKSINGRVNALGGRTFVVNSNLQTTISIEIPL